MKIALYARLVKNKHTQDIKELVTTMAQECEQLFIFPALHQFLCEQSLLNEKMTRVEEQGLQKNQIDYCVSIGGDGSFLHAATQVAHLSIPVIGINFGRIGFLTDVSVTEGKEIINKVKNKPPIIEERTMLNIKADTDCLNCFGKQSFAINEITLSKKDISTLLSLEMYIDDKYIHTYWADGVIVSTPTGSTGYNLSCNGPIVFPLTPCFVITPYASHNLNVRPLVVANNVRIRFNISCRTSKTFICTLDSRREELDINTRITITKEKFPLRIIKINNFDFVDALTQKLHWGLDTRNKS